MDAIATVLMLAGLGPGVPPKAFEPPVAWSPPIAPAPAPKPVANDSKPLSIVATPADPYDAAVQRAQREGLPLVVVFTDPAICPPCRTYETTLSDATLQAECVLLKVKTTQYPRLAQMLGVVAIPTTCISGPDLKGVTTLSGAVDRATLRDMIQQARK